MCPVRSTQPSPQACRVAVADRSAGFAHATTQGAPTNAFALLRSCATNTSARARSAEQPRTPGAFAYQAWVALISALKVLHKQLQTCFGQIRVIKSASSPSPLCISSYKFSSFL